MHFIRSNFDWTCKTHNSLALADLAMALTPNNNAFNKFNQMVETQKNIYEKEYD